MMIEASSELYKYLMKEISGGKIDFQMRATDVGDGVIEFYLHPQNASGHTIDFSLVKHDHGVVFVLKPTASPG